MGADYTFHVKIIETHARAFLTLNILTIGRFFYHLLLLPCRFGSFFSEVVWCKVSSDLERDGPRLFD